MNCQSEIVCKSRKEQLKPQKPNHLIFEEILNQKQKEGTENEQMTNQFRLWALSEVIQWYFNVFLIEQQIATDKTQCHRGQIQIWINTSDTHSQQQLKP